MKTNNIKDEKEKDEHYRTKKTERLQKIPREFLPPTGLYLGRLAVIFPISVSQVQE